MKMSAGGCGRYCGAATERRTRLVLKTEQLPRHAAEVLTVKLSRRRGAMFCSLLRSSECSELHLVSSSGSHPRDDLWRTSVRSRAQQSSAAFALRRRRRRRPLRTSAVRRGVTFKKRVHSKDSPSSAVSCSRPLRSASTQTPGVSHALHLSARRPQQVRQKSEARSRCLFFFFGYM